LIQDHVLINVGASDPMNIDVT